MKRLLASTTIALVLASCIGNIGGADDAPGQAQDDPTYGTEVDASDDGRALAFYYGPMKLMLGESILHSVTAVTGHAFGSFDFIVPDPATDAFVAAGNADGDFYRHCRLFGGCMEHRIPLERTSFVGTAYVLQLEKAVTEACSDRDAFGMFPDSQPPDAATAVIDIIEHQFLATFSVPPSPDEIEGSIAYFDAHISAPEHDDVLAIESAGRGHCRALLTTNRFLFY